VQLTGDTTRVTKLNARAAGTSWSGWLTAPRGCGAPADCTIDFDLKTNQLSFSELSEWVNPLPKERPWYRLLAPSSSSSAKFLAEVRASGSVSAERVQLKNISASRASAKISLDSGKLQVDDLKFDVLGGKHRGQWQADFTAKPGTCSGSGTLSGVSLSQIAETMDDAWISGVANANYKMKAECPAGFWTSAEGTFQFEARDGSLTHVSLTEDEGVLRLTRLRGEAHLHAGKLELKDAALDSGRSKYLLSGTAQFSKEISFKLSTPSNHAAGYDITGTLAEPRVQPSGAEQARLKPDSTK